MDKLKDMKSKLGFLIDKLKELTTKEGDRTKEEYEELQAKTTEATELRENIEKEEAAQKVLEELNTKDPEPDSEVIPKSGIEYPEEPGFRSFGEFLQAIAIASSPIGGHYEEVIEHV